MLRRFQLSIHELLNGLLRECLLNSLFRKSRFGCVFVVFRDEDMHAGVDSLKQVGVGPGLALACRCVDLFQTASDPQVDPTTALVAC
jgi:hypothetical protein